MSHGKSTTDLECGDLSPLSGNRANVATNEFSEALVARNTSPGNRALPMAPLPESAAKSAHSKVSRADRALEKDVRTTAATANLECGDLSPLSSDTAIPTGKNWPHAPVHRCDEKNLYMVTAATFGKEKLFSDEPRLNLLEHLLLSLAVYHGFQLEAWAVFENHYHFVARSNPQSAPLRRFISHLHSDSARELNRLDSIPGRKVWFNFWDSKLTFEKSYLARLNYVHQNAVKHGLVVVANQYKWCSAAWFERTGSAAMVKAISAFKTDRIQVPDDF